MLFVSRLFTVGNFGIVYKAWYTQENTHTKVAIKTLKGNLLYILSYYYKDTHTHMIK